MKHTARATLVISALLFLTVQVPVRAEEPSQQPDLSADALKSPANPPVIPHAVKPNQDGEECNACHREGLKGAPPTDHPERLNCTSCHVQGAKPDKKKKSGKK